MVHVVLAHDEAWRFSMVPELLQQGVVIWNCGDWSLCLSCAHDFLPCALLHCSQVATRDCDNRKKSILFEVRESRKERSDWQPLRALGSIRCRNGLASSLANQHF